MHLSVFLHYYLVGLPTEHADFLLLGLAQQIGQRANLLGLVLAETLMSLDRVKADPIAIFSGSSLLLQVL